MRIAINAHLLSVTRDYRGAGISRYIQSLLMNLPSTALANVFVFANNSGENRAFLTEAGVRYSISSLPTRKPIFRLLWEQINLPMLLKKYRIDVCHNVGFSTPIFWSGRNINTLFDLSFMRHPEFFKPANRMYLRNMTPISLRNSDLILAISSFVKNEAMSLCGINSNAIRAIPLAADDWFGEMSPHEIELARSELSVPKKYILYLGTLEPRKNLHTLIRAFAGICDGPASGYDLVLAGARGWYYQSLFDLVHQLSLTDRVIFPGFIPGPQQKLWYAAAEVFVYPSLYEGFGLPLVEAMSCGTPVVAARSSSLPEVVGDAGVLFDPHDSIALGHLLSELLVDLPRKQQMRRDGLNRASAFSWRTVGEETARAYDQIASV